MIYLDNAATTKMYEECGEVLKKYNEEVFFNPSARYKGALKAQEAMNGARERIASLLGADAGEIYFTASGSEADNMALLCSLRRKSGRVIISSVEHSAVYKCACELERRGYEIIFAPVTSCGAVDEEAFARLLTPDTVLVSIMHVCNETGAVNDIARLAALTKKRAPKALFHSDGVQAFCKVRVDLHAAGVDMYSVSAHKVHGPKGVGALYVKKGVNLSPFVHGGGQEKGVRSATENVAGICAFAKAARLAWERMRAGEKEAKEEFSEATAYLRENIDDIVIISQGGACVPGYLSLAVKGVRGEVLVHILDDEGIMIGTGSACSSHSKDKRIAQALGLKEEYFDGMLRLTAGDMNEKGDLLAACRKLVEAIRNERKFGAAEQR